MHKQKRTGFTLIELLVVISIIGLLSTLAVVAFSNARKKAKDSAVRQSVREFEKLMHFEFDATGSYTNLQSCIWMPISASDCSSMFSGTNAVKARQICKDILANALPIWGSPGYALLICNAVDNSQKFSIMASLNNGYWFCAGSSGVSDNVYYWSTPYPGGCYYNP